MRALFLLTLGVGVAGCSTVTGPPARDASTNFSITLDQPEYTRGQAGVVEIRAAVTNTSKDRDFYANVGDGFNSALEQPTIFAALGTDAVIERRVSATVWENANTGLLMEGSRFVVLSAGSSYRLVGSTLPKAPGIYRIRLDYSASHDDPTATVFHEYSATFRVR